MLLQVLSNPELREKYDKHGSQGLQVDFVDASMIFGMLFGSELFEPLVGEFLIAAATSKGRELSEAEIIAMQDARIGKLVVSLQSRLAPFVQGEKEAFREVQSINAEQLAAASFGEVMLQTIGRVYESEAGIALGNVFEVGFHKLRRTGQNIRCSSRQSGMIGGRSLCKSTLPSCCCLVHGEEWPADKELVFQLGAHAAMRHKFSAAQMHANSNVL